MIVVDTNVIAGFYISGDNADMIEALTAKDREWYAPYLWRSELRTVLAIYCRQSLLNPTQATLVTFDKKVLKQFPSIAISPADFIMS